MTDITEIIHKFTIEEEGYPSYSDALYFTLDQWPVDEMLLESMKQERFNNFKHAIDNPAPEPDPEEAP